MLRSCTFLWAALSLQHEICLWKSAWLTLCSAWPRFASFRANQSYLRPPGRSLGPPLWRPRSNSLCGRIAPWWGRITCSAAVATASECVGRPDATEIHWKSTFPSVRYFSWFFDKFCCFSWSVEWWMKKIYAHWRFWWEKTRAGTFLKIFKTKVVCVETTRTRRKPSPTASATGAENVNKNDWWESLFSVKNLQIFFSMKRLLHGQRRSEGPRKTQSWLRPLWGPSRLAQRTKLPLFLIDFTASLL